MLKVRLCACAVITKITGPLPIQTLTGFFFYSESVRVGVYCKPTVNLTRKGKRKSSGLIGRKEKYTWCYVCKVWICRIALRMRLPFCGVSQQQRGFLPTRFHTILLGKETGGECTAMQSVWDRKNDMVSSCHHSHSLKTKSGSHRTDQRPWLNTLRWKYTNNKVRKSKKKKRRWKLRNRMK